MENIVVTGIIPANSRTRELYKKKVPEPNLKLPLRGTTGPVHISVLIHPIREIIKYPDRNRLLAEFLIQDESGQQCF